MKRLILVVLVLLFTSIATQLFASGQQQSSGVSSGKMTLTVGYWLNQKGLTDAIQSAADKFMSEHPNVSVKLLQMPYNTYWQKIPSMAVSKQLPDVLEVATIVKYTMGRTHALADLMPYIKKDPSLKWNEYSEASRASVSYNNEVLILPYGMGASVFVYNRDMFKKAGLAYPGQSFTWQDMLNNAEKLTVRGSNGKVEQWGFSFSNGSGGAGFATQHAGGMQDFWLENDGTILNKAGTKAEFDTPANIQATKFVNDMIHKYKVSPTPSGYSGLGDLFETGRVAQENVGNWMLPEYKKVAAFDWDLHALPSNKKDVGIADVGGAGLSMSKYTKHPQMAWELLKLTNDYLAVADAKAGGEIPVKPAYREEWVSSPGPPYSRKQYLEWANTHTVARQITPGFLQWRTALQDQLTLAFSGDKTIPAALQDASQQTDRILTKAWGQ